MSAVRYKVAGGRRTTHPLYILPGGRKQNHLLKKQYRPIATAVLLPGAEPDDEEGGTERARSPRIMTSGWITVFPPSMMFCVPTRVALRETLLPVSWRGGASARLSRSRSGRVGKGGARSRCIRLAADVAP